MQDPPGQSPTEHVEFQYPQTAIDDERGTFVTASQRAPVSDPQTTDISPNPPSDSRQKQQLSKSTYWSYEPELELGEAALDEHLHDVEKDMLHASPRHHPKTKLGRAFPRAPSAPVHNHRDPNPPELSIEGVGTDMRARSAGTVPARAKSTDRHIVLLRQQEMLRKSPAKAYRTPPSIPSPFNPYGTRSPRRGAAYSTELEMHATKDSSPRHYLQKGQWVIKPGLFLHKYFELKGYLICPRSKVSLGYFLDGHQDSAKKSTKCPPRTLVDY